MSLSSLAKREHARKTLMSNFVRGKPIVPAVEETLPLKAAPSSPPTLKADDTPAASDVEVDAALNVVSPSSSSASASSVPLSKEEKAMKKRQKKDDEALQKKLAKKALRKKLKESQGLAPSSTPASESSAEPVVTSKDKKSKKSKDAKEKPGDREGKKEKKTKTESSAIRDPRHTMMTTRRIWVHRRSVSEMARQKPLATRKPRRRSSKTRRAM